MALIEELKNQGDFLFKYRGYLPILLFIAGILVRFSIDPNSTCKLTSFMEKSAIFVGLGGILIRCYCVGFSAKNTSGRNTSAGQVADSLNTTGLYSICRNPLYVGNYLMWLSIAMLTGSLTFNIIYSLIFWIYYERIVFAEEHFLRNKFGDPYLNWTKETPSFVPSHLKFKKGKGQFNWKKVLKAERNGLFLLFFSFFIFEMIDAYRQGTFPHTEKNWLLIGLIFSTILLVSVKIIKTYTSLLKE